jgi:dihydrofolate synthase/folylpolyglutamate synthase
LAYQSQLHPRAIDLSLERLRTVLERLDWRQPHVPVISVAGTNGKGSVTAYCTSILSAAGHRVGTFTSPHLRDYRERIRIHDRDVSEAELVAAFEKIEAARGDVSLTYFEFNALAAFLVFERADLDVWVLEIGMGGRLDAVNVVEPDVAVVVSIGLDHQEHLGDTLDAIAREKAGIFRAGRPAVIGGRAPLPVLETEARALGAVLKRLSIEYNYILEGEGWRYRGTHWNLPWLPAPALQGEVQFGNAATALAALEELTPRLDIKAEAVARGLSSVRLGGRFQVLVPPGGGPTWILDVAHNPDAAAVLARNLAATASSGRTLAVCGILADKDVAAILAPLRDRMDAWWCASIDGSRGQSGARLAEQVRHHVKVPVVEADSVVLACEAALVAAKTGDRIVVFGSFHTVGPALEWLEGERPPRAQDR